MSLSVEASEAAPGAPRASGSGLDVSVLQGKSGGPLTTCAIQFSLRDNTGVFRVVSQRNRF